jgi:hypothetical protein
MYRAGCFPGLYNRGGCHVAISALVNSSRVVRASSVAVRVETGLTHCMVLLRCPLKVAPMQGVDGLLSCLLSVWTSSR